MQGKNLFNRAVIAAQPSLSDVARFELSKAGDDGLKFELICLASRISLSERLGLIDTVLVRLGLKLLPGIPLLHDLAVYYASDVDAD